MFKPKRDESYHLWYAVGGGGGHSLHLSNVTIQTLVFDDSSHSFAKASNFLAENNIFCGWNVMKMYHESFKAVLESTNYLLEKGDPLLPQNSFVCQHGLSEEDLSLTFLESIKWNSFNT